MISKEKAWKLKKKLGNLKFGSKDSFITRQNKTNILSRIMSVDLEGQKSDKNFQTK